MATPVNDYRFWWDEQNIQHIADNGRYLMVVFAPKGGNRVRVITARDLTAKEKRSARKP